MNLGYHLIILGLFFREYPPHSNTGKKKSFKTCLEDTWSFPSAKGTVIRKIEMPTRTSISLLKYFL